MKRLALAILLASTSLAQAQQFSMPPPAGVVILGTRVVAACGAQTLTANSNPGFISMDVTGNLCTNATGGGGGGGAVTIANGADTNAGSTTDAAAAAGGTGTMSAKLREMSAQLQSIITALGSLTISGTVTANQGTAGSAWPVSVADGASVALGATTDAAAAAGGTGTLSAKLREITSQLDSIITALNQPSTGFAATTSTTNTYANGATSNLNTDLHGNLYVSQGGTIPWTVQGPGASGAALTGNPFRIGLSDGTNTQNWLAALALADGVNGNNTGAVGPWWYNGTTWDRARGDATNGLIVQLKEGGNLATIKPGSTPAADGDTALVVAERPMSIGAGHFIVAANDNHQTVKNGAGVVFMVSVTTLSSFSGSNYIRLYDAGTGFNACNSATGLIGGFVFSAPGIAITLAGSHGVSFATGLSVCVTANATDTDTTNATAGPVANIAWK